MHKILLLLALAILAADNAAAATYTTPQPAPGAQAAADIPPHPFSGREESLDVLKSIHESQQFSSLPNHNQSSVLDYNSKSIEIEAGTQYASIDASASAEQLVAPMQKVGAPAVSDEESVDFRYIKDVPELVSKISNVINLPATIKNIFPKTPDHLFFGLGQGAKNADYFLPEAAAKYDYIVIGCGAAGCPLAAELVKAGKDVLVVERGMQRTNVNTPNAMDIRGAGIALADNTITQAVATQQGVRTFAPAVMGGGSAVNLGIMVGETRKFFHFLNQTFPGNNWDIDLFFEKYDQVGQRVASIMPTLESFGPRYHQALANTGFKPFFGRHRHRPGDSNTNRLSRPSLYIRLGHLWQGYSLFDSKNEFYRNASDVFLPQNNPKLTLMTRTFVERILFSHSQGKPPVATCITFRSTLYRDIQPIGSVLNTAPSSAANWAPWIGTFLDGRTVLQTLAGVDPRKVLRKACLSNPGKGKIIITAGAVQTPLLLLRSGVGAEKDLRLIGAPVVLDQPQVGRNFGDRVFVSIPAFVGMPEVDGPGLLSGDPHVFARRLTAEEWSTPSAPGTERVSARPLPPGGQVRTLKLKKRSNQAPKAPEELQVFVEHTSQSPVQTFETAHSPQQTQQEGPAVFPGQGGEAAGLVEGTQGAWLGVPSANQTQQEELEMEPPIEFRDNPNPPVILPDSILFLGMFDRTREKLEPRIAQFMGLAQVGTECNAGKILDKNLRCSVVGMQELSGGRTAEGFIHASRFIFPPALRKDPIIDGLMEFLLACSNYRAPFDLIVLKPLCVVAFPIVKCFRKAVAPFYFTSEPKSRGTIKLKKNGQVDADPKYLSDEQDLFDAVRGVSKLIEQLNSGAYRGIVEKSGLASCPVTIANGLLDVLLALSTASSPFVANSENLLAVQQYLQDLVPIHSRRPRRLAVLSPDAEPSIYADEAGKEYQDFQHLVVPRADPQTLRDLGVAAVVAEAGFDLESYEAHLRGERTTPVGGVADTYLEEMEKTVNLALPPQQVARLLEFAAQLQLETFEKHVAADPQLQAAVEACRQSCSADASETDSSNSSSSSGSSSNGTWVGGTCKKLDLCCRAYGNADCKKVPGFKSLHARSQGAYRAADGVSESSDGRKRAERFPGFEAAEAAIGRLEDNMDDPSIMVNPQWAATYPPRLPSVLDPKGVAKLVLTFMTSIGHVFGSAKMGAVVDDKFSVKGVRGLAVADASVLPQLTRLNPVFTVMALGKYAADLILNEEEK